MNLDRFSVGLADPQEEQPTAVCEVCGWEIYSCCDAYELGGKTICDNPACIAKAGGAEEGHIYCDICHREITTEDFYRIGDQIVCDNYKCLIEATGARRAG